ncbi:Alpha-hemolysin translocation ATP-binding protein HlyB [compost metagenome]
MLVSLISQFSMQSKEFNNFRIVFENEDVHQNKLNITEPEISVPLHPFIEFRNVSLKYENTPEAALENVSFTINKGEKIAIVGHNGAGKTSLYYCLLGLIRPTEGNIFVYGRDPFSLTPEERSNIFSVLFQDFSIYSGFSIEENVTIGRQSIKKVSKELLGVDNLDTLLGHNIGGINLSGGQKQKIAFIRAVLGTQDVVVLDEPTSALDPIAEETLISQHLTGNKTFILTTHRLGITLKCDQIFVLHNGKIAEQGSPGKLLSKTKGLFKNMFDNQGEIYRNTIKENS